MEAGMKGFWYQYHNIFKLVSDLAITPNPFTDWTESSFYGPDGKLITTGPVFQRQPKLPTMLGQAVYTFPRFDAEMFSPADLASILAMFPSMMDFNSSEEAYEAYDQMTAKELFRSSGVTSRMYEKFLKPLLLVGLFAPAEELSAASVLETLYFYAAGHQNDFDVCWCRGPVSERIFEPLVSHIESKGGVIKGGQAVVDVQVDSGRVTGVLAKDLDTKEDHTYKADAVVMAVGINGMQAILRSSDTLAGLDEFRRIMNLRCIDCVATRLWFDKRVDVSTPSNVFAGFEENIGGTFFHLNDLHDEYAAEGKPSVITADFYHANEFIPMSDEEIIDRVKMHLGTCIPGFQQAKVNEYNVVKFPKAVTHFSPGSHRNRPKQRTSFPNLFMAGDWVKGLDHGANGLSQERAFVTGLAAANEVVEALRQGNKAEIIPVEADEPHIVLAKMMAKQRRLVFPKAGNLGLPGRNLFPPRMW